MLQFRNLVSTFIPSNAQYDVAIKSITTAIEEKKREHGYKLNFV